ncbi:MAG: ComEA family DNA-binding protein [Steroidobacteraceae bacterium]
MLEEGSLPVNVNTATKVELESIPGIGPALAAQIIAGRPYSRIEDLERVHGLGRNLVNSLRPSIKVDGETVKRSE